MENQWQNQKKEFDDLVGLWDKALADGIFKDSPKGNPEKSDFFGNYKVDVKEEADGDQVQRWNDIISRSGEIVPDEGTMLMEAAKKKAKSEKKLPDGTDKGQPLNDLVKTSLEKDTKLSKKKKAKVLANTPNPVYPDTVGSDTVDKDGHVKVTAGLAAHPKYKELEELKKKLYELEVEMIKDIKNKTYDTKIKSVKDKIAKISDNLGGTYKNSQYTA